MEKKITGIIDTNVDSELDNFASSKNQKKMGLIGIIINGFLKSDKDIQDEIIELGNEKD